MKMLRKYDEENHGRTGLLMLANILVSPFHPYQNAPPEVCPERHSSQWLMQGDYEGKLTALEVAIISESKVFLSGSACQKIIDAVYWGRIVYTVSPPSPIRERGLLKIAIAYVFSGHHSRPLQTQADLFIRSTESTTPQPVPAYCSQDAKYH